MNTQRDIVKESKISDIFSRVGHVAHLRLSSVFVSLPLCL